MKKYLAMIVAFAVTFVAGCSSMPEVSNPFGGGSEFDDQPLKIVAATELQDLEPLVERASNDLGFPIELEFPAGTLENSQSLKDGEFDGVQDATWFATNRYVDLIDASDKLANETKIATSPVAFGVWRSDAVRLGWDSRQPNWQEFADAAAAGEFTFGMTDPTTSNSGFSALVSVATALADTGGALTQADIDRVSDQMRDLYRAQAMVSGSSGWLADSFADSPGEVSAIINYESTLHQLRDEGVDITVIVPNDGVISADYPLSTLSNPLGEQAAEKVAALSGWLLERQDDIAGTYRRPVSDVESLPQQLESQQVFELAFPGNYGVVEKLLASYNNDYRRPGSTTFVLDTSGSMEGERIASLKEIMTSLIDGTASTSTGNVALRTNEDVTIHSFASEPHEPLRVQFAREDPAVHNELLTYVHSLNPYGYTAVYQTLLDALRNADTSTGIPSIVLLSDGEVTAGPDYNGFVAEYHNLPEDKKNIPVFVIVYGEASEQEMQDVAELTGGEVFKAQASNEELERAFKEIRGFQ